MVCWFLVAVASLVAVHRLSSCVALAYLPCSMWDLSSLTRDLHWERKVLATGQLGKSQKLLVIEEFNEK